MEDFNSLFSGIQDDFDRLLYGLEKVRAADEAAGQKCTAAFRALIDNFSERID